MKQNNLNWRDRRSLKNVSKDAKIQLTDGTHIDATDVKDIAKKVDTVIGTGDTTEQIDTLNEVLNFLQGFDNTDNLDEIIKNTKPVELTEYIGQGKELPLASSYTYYGLPVSHYRFTDISDDRYLLVFCVGHDSQNITGHVYIVYAVKDEPNPKCIFVETFNDILDDPKYAPANIRALFGNVLPGEELENGIVERGLMTLEDKEKLDNLQNTDTSNLATKTEVNAKYTKPSAGIPKTDLDSAVQSSLNKADSALQTHQDISHLATKEEVEDNEKVTAAALVDLETRKANKEDIPSIPTKVSELTNDSGFITTHQDISGKQDVITDLATIRSGAAKGATSLQTSQRGVANGVASLDSTGKVPSSQLPSYVDDVLEYTYKSNFPTTGESGKIYVETSTNKTYRWSGSTYVEISSSINTSYLVDDFTNQTINGIKTFNKYTYFKSGVNIDGANLSGYSYNNCFTVNSSSKVLQLKSYDDIILINDDYLKLQLNNKDNKIHIVSSDILWNEQIKQEDGSYINKERSLSDFMTKLINKFPELDYESSNEFEIISDINDTVISNESDYIEITGVDIVYGDCTEFTVINEVGNIKPPYTIGIISPTDIDNLDNVIEINNNTYYPEFSIEFSNDGFYLGCGTEGLLPTARIVYIKTNDKIYYPRTNFN